MYVTKDEFRGAGTMPVVQGATAAAIPDDQLNDLIEKASRYFDLLCGVIPGYFEAAEATPNERTFYGDGTRFLRLDRYVSGSLNTSIGLPDGYTAPEFVERDGYLVTTSNGVIHASPWSECGGWYSGVPIRVTAKWGFTATPADVKLAVIELTANLWSEVDPKHVKLVNIEGQPLREKYPPRVWEISKRYRLRTGVLV